MKGRGKRHGNKESYPGVYLFRKDELRADLSLGKSLELEVRRS
jgi:hypothetical protein